MCTLTQYELLYDDTKAEGEKCDTSLKGMLLPGNKLVCDNLYMRYILFIRLFYTHKYVHLAQYLLQQKHDFSKQPLIWLFAIMLENMLKNTVNYNI